MMTVCRNLLLGLAGGALVTAPVQAEPVKIGASLPITGGLAINGQKHKDGYELCVDLINQAGGLLGDPVELVISDNQSSNETAQAQFERLINEDQVDVLLGTFSSRLTFPTTSIAEQNQMVYPIPSGVALQIYERGYKYIFNFQPNAAEYVGKSYQGLMQDLVKPDQLPKKAAVVYADDFYANAVVAGLTGKTETIAGTDKEIDLSPGALASAGIEVVFEQQWPEDHAQVARGPCRRHLRRQAGAARGHGQRRQRGGVSRHADEGIQGDQQRRDDHHGPQQHDLEMGRPEGIRRLQRRVPELGAGRNESRKDAGAGGR